MRTPLWIINFNEKGTPSAFFGRWWRAYAQNTDTAPGPEDKWFYVTDCFKKTYDDVLDDAAHRTLPRNGREPLIPVFGGLGKPNSLVVLFFGDITDENTIHCFHFWAASLRGALLSQETQWTTVPSVRFYAFLWRPNTAGVAPGVPKETRGFLQELNMLMKEDVNHAPFRSVCFIESSANNEDKQAALEQMNIAALHLSANDFLGDEQSRRFVDLSATGVYYEAAVHAQQGEFLLSNALMDKIAHSDDPEFFNAKAAQDFVDSDDAFLETFTAKTFVASLKEDCPVPDVKTYAYDLVPGISPWSSKLRKVWEEYYCDFIPNYKKNLVNRVKRGLSTFVRDYREKLYANQTDVITKESQRLQKQVFSIFTHGTATQYVSISQAEEILRLYRKKIEEEAGDALGVNFSVFAIPDELRGAAKQAEAEHRTPKEAIAVLEHKIAHHPVAVFALLIRAVVLGLLLGFLGWTFLPLFMETTPALALSVVLGALPLGVSLLKFRIMRIRIKALKNQYIGVMLRRSEEELRKDILECLKVTYEELLEYCDWLKANKLDFLRKHLSVLSPSEFSFVETPVLKPLVKAGNLTTREEESVVLIPPVSLKAFDDVRLSGSFRKEPLLNFENTNGMHKININGVDHDIKAIMKSNAHLSTLARDLMNARIKVKRSIEREATFLSRDVHGKTLLLLDVSGSMGGQPLEDLKKAVHSLEESYEVEWIAFDDKIVASSFEEGSSIDSLSSGGGTCFIPPLEMAAQKVREAIYDDIILISDGSPFENTESILAVAYQLQQPLNTISIGNDGASVMKELSEKTNGTQIVVSEVREIIHWEGKMQAVVQLGENGEFSFGELIAKCHIPGCAQAMRVFVASRLISEYATLGSLISRYPGKGLGEWALLTRQGATLTPTRQILDEQYLLGTDETTSNDPAFIMVAEKHLSAPVHVSLDGPLMLATLVYARGLALRDFTWAGLDENCSDLNNKAGLSEIIRGATITNLYDRPIR